MQRYKGGASRALRPFFKASTSKELITGAEAQASKYIEDDARIFLSPLIAMGSFRRLGLGGDGVRSGGA